MSRRKDEDIRKLEEAWQLGLVPKASEPNVVKVKLQSARFESGSLLAIADDDEIGPILKLSSRSEVSISFEQVIRMLARLQLRCKQDDRPFRVKPKLYAQLLFAR